MRDQTSYYLVTCDQVWNPKDVKLESQSGHLVSSKKFSYNLTIGVAKLDAATLYKQCQFKLIKDRHVPTAESQQQFKKISTGKRNQTKDFKPSPTYNVTCSHEDSPELYFIMCSYVLDNVVLIVIHELRLLSIELSSKRKHAHQTSLRFHFGFLRPCVTK